MSAADVLAVLKRHADLAEQFACAAQIAEAHAVYAAVAELVECNRDALGQLAFILADYRLSAERANSCNRTIKRIEVSLARVQGGAT